MWRGRTVQSLAHSRCCRHPPVAGRIPPARSKKTLPIKISTKTCLNKNFKKCFTVACRLLVMSPPASVWPAHRPPIAHHHYALSLSIATTMPTSSKTTLMPLCKSNSQIVYQCMKTQVPSAYQHTCILRPWPATTPLVGKPKSFGAQNATKCGFKSFPRKNAGKYQQSYL